MDKLTEGLTNYNRNPETIKRNTEHNEKNVLKEAAYEVEVRADPLGPRLDKIIDILTSIDRKISKNI